jgi:TetR/AcrR family transcriptional repressor of nem operon
LQLKKPKSAISRERILNAGRELILARGLSAMTVDAVCRSAEITKGGFFHYFPSKDALCEAALKQFWSDALERQAKARFNNETDPLRYLEGYLDFAIEAYQSPDLQKGCMLAILTMERADGNEQLFQLAAKYFAEWRAALYEMFERVATHTGINIDAQAWGDLYISTLEGALLLTKPNNDADTIKRVLTLYKNLMVQTLQPTS